MVQVPLAGPGSHGVGRFLAQSAMASGGDAAGGLVLVCEGLCVSLGLGWPFVAGFLASGGSSGRAPAGGCVDAVALC